MIRENPDQFLKPSVFLERTGLNSGHWNVTFLFSCPIIQTNLLFPRWFEKLGIYHYWFLNSKLTQYYPALRSWYSLLNLSVNSWPLNYCLLYFLFSVMDCLHWLEPSLLLAVHQVWLLSICSIRIYQTRVETCLRFPSDCSQCYLSTCADPL